MSVLTDPLPQAARGTRVEAMRRARWAVAHLGSAGVLALGWWWNAGYVVEQSPLAPALGWAGRGIGALAAVCAAVGTWQLLRAVRFGVNAYGWKRVLLLSLGGLGCLAALGAALFAPFIGLLYGCAGLLTALVLAAGGPRDEIPNHTMSPTRRVWLAIPFAVVALLMLGAVLLHVFVWNPLAKLPGMTLDEIYAEMNRAGEGNVGAVTVTIVVIGGLIVLAPLVLAGTRVLGGPRSTRRIIVLGLLSIALTSGLSFFLGFGMGMGIADTFGTDGGDAAASGSVFSMLGLLALVAAIFAGVAPVSGLRAQRP